MLRIDWDNGHIPTDYDDHYLELVRLLVEGAGLEHSLMAAYLYSLFSIKDRYDSVRGDITEDSYLLHSPAGRGGMDVLYEKDTFLDVALEEMQHLSLVNRYLCDLGAAPNFIPHVFPYASDLYPFAIDLRSLDRYAAATYLWIEADDCKLSQSARCKDRSESPRFIREVRRVLGAGSKRFKKHPAKIKLDHVGSLYRKVVLHTRRVADHPPAFLPKHFPWGEWEDKMNWILYQGELTHYRFFREVFTGKAFGSDAGVWEPGNKDYPAHHFKHETAYTARANTIPNEKARRLAWLADLHYWIILALLDVAYRSVSLTLRYKAIDGMTLGLWYLGKHLARKYHVGVPFDPMGPQYALGRNEAMSLLILRRLVLEASRRARELEQDGLLPDAYDPTVFAMTLTGLSPASAGEAEKTVEEARPTTLPRQRRGK